MKKDIKYLLIVLAVFIGQRMSAQTLHAVVFCNTIDESIGKSMGVEYQNVLNQIQTLNQLLDYDLDLHQLDGSKCTRANLKTIIDEMDVEPEDVIFTFYGGHGTHAMNNESDPWPQYMMNSGFENQSNWVPMAELDKWVAVKNARLRIIMSNCCNKEQASTTIKPLWADDGRATKLDGLNAENYQKLFASKGWVMATSSKLGQYSWCNPYGGIYTNDFWNVMRMVGTGQVAPNWESVLKKTYDMCSAREIRTNDYPYKAVQNPYYKVNVGEEKPPVTRHDDEPNASNLVAALSSLTNKSINVDTRIDMIPDIISKYFDSGAKVITVGNDMKTQFEYEDVQDFLRRICLSDYIKGVSIVNESRTLLKVHELR